LDINLDALLLARMAACAFFATVFIQSSLDKLLDRKGNLAWMVPHFEKSPFNGTVPVFLSLLTVIELCSGFGSAAAIVALAFDIAHWLPISAMACVCLNLIALMTGQRWAKDYAAAAALTGYFACALIGLMLMSGR
jgi:putative oxidoreductase